MMKTAWVMVLACVPFWAWGPATADASLGLVHRACAQSAANDFAGALSPVLARQGHWVAQAELESRVAFGVLRERHSPGRGSVADPLRTYMALFRPEADPATVSAYADAYSTARNIEDRHLALLIGLDYLLRGWPFGVDAAADRDLFVALDRLLGEGEADVGRLGGALHGMGLARGHHFADRGILQAVRARSRNHYQACVNERLAGRGPGPGLAEAAPAPACTAFAETPATVGEVFGISHLLSEQCLAELAPPVMRAQLAQLLATRERGMALSPGGPPRTPMPVPNQGPLRTQVLSPEQLSVLLGRAFAVDTHCHARTARLYEQVMGEFLIAAERHAANALEREYAARVQRTAAELTRLLRGLDNNRSSAAQVNAALDTGRRVDNAANSLRNLTGHARSTRDRVQGAIEALDAPGLVAELDRDLGALQSTYGEQRAMLALWAARHEQPETQASHPAFREDPVRGRSADYRLPYTVQVQDRYLRGQVQAAANLANAHLGACWQANQPAIGLGALSPQPGSCDAMQQLRRPFGEWEFLRTVEHVVAERCTARLEVLSGPLAFVDPPWPSADVARLADRARQDAAILIPGLADALAQFDQLTAQANAVLAELNALFAEIQRKLDQPSAEQLAKVERTGEAGAWGIAALAPETAVPARQQSFDEICAERQAEARARDEPMGVRTYVFNDTSVLRAQRAGGVREDFRAATSDNCLVYQCPVAVAEEGGLDGCIAHQQNLLQPPPPDFFQKALKTMHDADGWITAGIELSPRLHRLANPQGDTVLAQGIDYLNTNLCLWTDIVMPGGRAREAFATAFEAVLGRAGSYSTCDVFVSGPFAPVLGR
jgi:hypothetical protein